MVGHLGTDERVTSGEELVEVVEIEMARRVDIDALDPPVSLGCSQDRGTLGPGDQDPSARTERGDGCADGLRDGGGEDQLPWGGVDQRSHRSAGILDEVADHQRLVVRPPRIGLGDVEKLREGSGHLGPER